MPPTSFSMRLPEKLGGRLSACAAKMARPKADIVREALAEWLEDAEDCEIALRRKNARHKKSLSAADIRRRLSRHL